MKKYILYLYIILGSINLQLYAQNFITKTLRSTDEPVSITHLLDRNYRPSNSAEQAELEEQSLAQRSINHNLNKNPTHRLTNRIETHNIIAQLNKTLKLTLQDQSNLASAIDAAKAGDDPSLGKLNTLLDAIVAKNNSTNFDHIAFFSHLKSAEKGKSISDYITGGINYITVTFAKIVKPAEKLSENLETTIDLKKAFQETTQIAAPGSGNRPQEMLGQKPKPAEPVVETNAPTPKMLREQIRSLLPEGTVITNKDNDLTLGAIDRKLHYQEEPGGPSYRSKNGIHNVTDSRIIAQLLGVDNNPSAIKEGITQLRIATKYSDNVNVKEYITQDHEKIINEFLKNISEENNPLILRAGNYAQIKRFISTFIDHINVDKLKYPSKQNDSAPKKTDTAQAPKPAEPVVETTTRIQPILREKIRSLLPEGTLITKKDDDLTLGAIDRKLHYQEEPGGPSYRSKNGIHNVTDSRIIAQLLGVDNNPTAIQERIKQLRDAIDPKIVNFSANVTNFQKEIINDFLKNISEENDPLTVRAANYNEIKGIIGTFIKNINVNNLNYSSTQDYSEPQETAPQPAEPKSNTLPKVQESGFESLTSQNTNPAPTPQAPQPVTNRNKKFIPKTRMPKTKSIIPNPETIIPTVLDEKSPEIDRINNLTPSELKAANKKAQDENQKRFAAILAQAAEDEAAKTSAQKEEEKIANDAAARAKNSFASRVQKGFNYLAATTQEAATNATQTIKNAVGLPNDDETYEALRNKALYKEVPQPSHAQPINTTDPNLLASTAKASPEDNSKLLEELSRNIQRNQEILDEQNAAQEEAAKTPAQNDEQDPRPTIEVLPQAQLNSDGASTLPSNPTEVSTAEASPANTKPQGSLVQKGIDYFNRLINPPQ